MPRVEVEEVLSPLGEEWANMTFSHYRHLLPLLGTGEADEQGHRPIACRARVGGGPGGLVLARLGADNPFHAELVSLFVASDFRGQGIATELLRHFEEAALVRYSVRLITGVYMTPKPTTAALERVFAKRGFSDPAVRKVVLRFTPEEASHCEWYKKAVLPPDSEIVAWKDLTSDERERLQQSQAETAWIHPELEPWRVEANFDETSSVALRKGGEVVGWVINHRVKPDLVSFTTSFVRRDLARRGAIFPLYVASLKTLDNSGVMCSFVTDAQFESMVRFTRRRCAPFATFLGETRGVTKDLFGAPG